MSYQIPSDDRVKDVCQKIQTNFAKSGRNLFHLKPDDFDDIISHAGSYGDEFTLSCLPRLLCLAISIGDEMRDERIRTMVEFLDVDFFEEIPGLSAVLKGLNMIRFNKLCDLEKDAVKEWLEFVRDLAKDNEFDSDQVASALRYWSQ